jgi:uncharacterized cupredoxin-like copper-binding protein
MKKTHLYFAVLTLLLAGVILNGCGGSQTASNTADTTKTYTPPPAPPYDPSAIDPKAPVVTLNLAADGNTMTDMHYTPDTLTIKAGSTVKINFKNNGKDASMQHNFVLIKSGTAESVATAAINIENHIPPSSDVLYGIPSTKPGSLTVITFAAPPAGKYQFVCTYPGHWQKMQGAFIVQ